ncbi:hypothetical protein CHX26_11830 [Porphyrobacter sp. HT-58-2]|nr:hypothetical protein CHX26_11830 [Porphyrobacter sp. HT-58-2]
MEQALSARLFAALVLALPLLGAREPTTGPLTTHPWVTACKDRDDRDKPGPAFQVYRNTYYVGTCGVSAILVTSPEGHLLIDSGTEAGAEVVLANIRALGFDPKDIKLLLGSHEHSDHIGGLLTIQEITRAPIVTSFEGLNVIASGQATKDDPRYGTLEPMRSLPESSYTIEPSPILRYNEPKAQFLLDKFGVWPIPTPGYSPAAMSWTWRDCEGDECLTIIYAANLLPVSRDDYKFTDNPRYVHEFLASLQRIADAPCDILLTPLPSASKMRDTLRAGSLNASYAYRCDSYTRFQRSLLIDRLLQEDPEWMKKNFPQGIK